MPNSLKKSNARKVESITTPPSWLSQAVTSKKKNKQTDTDWSDDWFSSLNVEKNGAKFFTPPNISTIKSWKDLPNLYPHIPSAFSSEESVQPEQNRETPVDIQINEKNIIDIIQSIMLLSTLQSRIERNKDHEQYNTWCIEFNAARMKLLQDPIKFSSSQEFATLKKSLQITNAKPIDSKVHSLALIASTLIATALTATAIALCTAGITPIHSDAGLIIILSTATCVTALVLHGLITMLNERSNNQSNKTL